VDLTANVLEADDDTRTALSQQIVWTLRQLPEVQAVEITAVGQPLLLPGVPSPQPRDSWPQVDPNAMPLGSRGYATRPEGVVELQTNGVLTVPGGAGEGEVTLIDIAVAADSGSMAGIDTEGAVWRSRLSSGAAMIKIREQGLASSLAFDGSSSVWVVDDVPSLPFQFVGPFQYVHDDEGRNIPGPLCDSAHGFILHVQFR